LQNIFHVSDSQDCIVLLLLNSILVPSIKYKVGTETKQYKPSIMNGQQRMVMLLPNIADLEVKYQNIIDN
jgi:hypothetical protein